MRNIHLFCLILLMGCNTQAQKKAVKNSVGDLVGITHRSDFKQAPYNSWFDANYIAYTVDQKSISVLKDAFKDVQVKVFMGTWCGDSRRETPRFYKLLDAINFDEKNLEMITVNRSKKTPKNLEQNLNIIRVPTFIFYKKDPKTNEKKEIGRYVEYARESLEKDILKILSGQAYKHSYQN